ncbi:MAG: hypothetical protein ACK5O7_07380 [Holosporales bacterium]
MIQFLAFISTAIFVFGNKALASHGAPEELGLAGYAQPVGNVVHSEYPSDMPVSLDDLAEAVYFVSRPAAKRTLVDIGADAYMSAAKRRCGPQGENLPESPASAANFVLAAPNTDAFIDGSTQQSPGNSSDECAAPFDGPALMNTNHSPSTLVEQQSIPQTPAAPDLIWHYFGEEHDYPYDTSKIEIAPKTDAFIDGSTQQSAGSHSNECAAPFDGSVLKETNENRVFHDDPSKLVDQKSVPQTSVAPVYEWRDYEEEEELKNQRKIPGRTAHQKAVRDRIVALGKQGLDVKSVAKEIWPELPLRTACARVRRAFKNAGL